ncbi:MAG: LytTR family transcriptional regulator [Burkholderiales bacterium]|nr:LytTR family transcriptional regulator [Burkholderiales bacterium]
MNKSAPDLLARYQPWKPLVEPGFWIAFYTLQALVNGWIAWIDVNNGGLVPKIVKPWQPGTWHVSGNLALLVLVPAVVAFERRIPLQWATLKRHLPFHLLASMVYGTVHFLLTVALIKLAYLSMGDNTRLVDNWWNRLFFQYLNDFRFYFFVIIVLNFYRFMLLQLQGEAKLLDVPEEGPPVEPVERPERFLVRKRGKEFLLPATDIEWIQAAGNYVNLRVRGHDYLLRSTMAAIEARLNPKRFVRVHRSYITNLDHVVQLEQLESGDARIDMSDNSQVPVSRKYLDQFRKALAA